MPVHSCVQERLACQTSPPRGFLTDIPGYVEHNIAVRGKDSSILRFLQSCPTYGDYQSVMDMDTSSVVWSRTPQWRWDEDEADRHLFRTYICIHVSYKRGRSNGFVLSCFVLS